MNNNSISETMSKISLLAMEKIRKGYPDLKPFTPENRDEEILIYRAACDAIKEYFKFFSVVHREDCTLKLKMPEAISIYERKKLEIVAMGIGRELLKSGCMAQNEINAYKNLGTPFIETEYTLCILDWQKKLKIKSET